MNNGASDERTESPPAQPQLQGGTWSQDEHDRYLEGLQLFPSGPWRDIADHVGTRSVRQVQTHAQKYHEKVARRMRGLHKERKKLLRPEHRIDDGMLSLCRELKSERLSVASSSTSISTPSQAKQQQPRRSLLQDRYAGYIVSNAELCGSSSFQRCNRQDHVEQHHAAGGYSPSTSYPDARSLQYERHQLQAYHSEAHITTAAMVAHRPKSELPSFHDCLDFLIDVFGSKEYSDATWYRQHQRRP